MMGRTHLLLGFNTLWIFEVVPNVWAQDTDRLAIGLLAAGVGALLPDLDASASLLQNVSIGGVRPLILPAQVLHRSLGHRGALHSLLALGVVGALALPLARVDLVVWLCLLLGFVSHLVGDACTKSGIPLFYPRRASIHLLPRPLRLSTGSSAEEAFFAVFALGALSLLLCHLFMFPLL